MITQIKLKIKFKDFIKLLEDMCNNGYGNLPPTWAIKLWLERN